MIKNIDYIIESGTGGHWDEDGCPLLIKQIKNPSNDIVIPRIGETIQFRSNNDKLTKYLDYLVNDIVYMYTTDDDVYIRIAILPIGHSI